MFGPKGMDCGVVIRSLVARVTEAYTPVYALFRKGPIGSKSLMLWLEFILNTFLVVPACERVNHK